MSREASGVDLLVAMTLTVEPDMHDEVAGTDKDNLEVFNKVPAWWFLVIMVQDRKDKGGSLGNM